MKSCILSCRVKKQFILKVFFIFFSNSLLIAQENSHSESQVTVRNCTVSFVEHVTLSVDRPGIIGKVLSEEGDHILEGSLMAQLDNKEAATKYELAKLAAKNEIQIRLAEATRQVAEVELKQAELLNRNQQVITEFEIRRLKLTLDQAELQRNQAIHEQQLKIQEEAVSLAQLKMHDVHAPFAGTVVRVFKHPGESIQQGEPLVELVNSQYLRVEGYIPLQESLKIKTGQTVTIKLEEGSAPLGQGNLHFIDLSVQSVTQEVRIWSKVNNDKGKLTSGQIVTMIFEN